MEILPHCETRGCTGEASNLLTPVARRDGCPSRAPCLWLCAECRVQAVAAGNLVSFIPTKIMSRLMEESRTALLCDVY